MNFLTLEKIEGTGTGFWAGGEGKGALKAWSVCPGLLNRQMHKQSAGTKLLLRMQVVTMRGATALADQACEFSRKEAAKHRFGRARLLTNGK